MKICIDISQAQYQGTGVGNYTYQLIKHLLKLDKQNDYLLFGGSLRGFFKLKSIAQSLSTNNKILPLPPTLSDLLFNQFHQLPIEFFTGPVDIFHASDWTHPKAKSAKTITTIHDLTTLKFPEHHHPKTIAVHQRRLNLVKREAAAVIADSAATKNDIVELLGIDETKIHVVHLAASPDFTAFAKLAQAKKISAINFVKQKYGLKDYTLSVGTNEPRKNLARTVEAFTSFSSANKSNLQLAIAGKFGWGNTDVRDTNPQIKALGFIPQSDLPALYAGASTFIYPSLYEGFGLPVLEAMTIGIPVVTTNRGSLKEVAGGAALLVDPKSSQDIARGIKLALSNQSKYIGLGLKQAKNFSWTKTASETLKVYEQVNQSAI